MGIFLSIRCLYPSLLFTLRYSLESTDTDQNPICISFPKLQNSWGRKPYFLTNCRYLALSILLLLIIKKKLKTQTCIQCEHSFGNPNNHRISLPQETTKLTNPESKTEKPVTLSTYTNLHNPWEKKKFLYAPRVQ